MGGCGYFPNWVGHMPRVVLLETSRQSTFDNRVGWARTYLKKAGLLANPRRGVMNITDRGREVLSTCHRRSETVGNQPVPGAAFSVGLIPAQELV